MNLTLEKILLTTPEAAESLGVSERHFISLERSGQIGPLPIRLGRSVRYSFEALQSWAAQGCPSNAYRD